MKSAFAAILFISGAASASAQVYAANDYRTCPQPQTQKGLTVVESACGTLTRPNFTPGSLNTLADLQRAQAERDGFNTSVADYGVCITKFINSYRRPGADATSTAPDEAACAHAWAEDQATEVVREYGRSCIEFSNRSMTDTNIEPWSGECYPQPANAGSHG